MCSGAGEVPHPGLQRLPAFFAHLYTLVVVFFGWVLFYFTDFTQGIVVLKGLFGLNGNPLINLEGRTMVLNYVFFLAVAVLACTPLPRMLYHKSPPPPTGRPSPWARYWNTRCQHAI